MSGDPTAVTTSRPPRHTFPLYISYFQVATLSLQDARAREAYHFLFDRLIVLQLFVFRYLSFRRFCPSGLHRSRLRRRSAPSLRMKTKNRTSTATMAEQAFQYENISEWLSLTGSAHFSTVGYPM